MNEDNELKNFYNELRKIESNQNGMNAQLTAIITKIDILFESHNNKIIDINRKIEQIEDKVNDNKKINDNKISELNKFMYKTLGASAALLTAATLLIRLGII